MKAFDWFGRLLLLMLSGLSTFAIILSLQTASQGGGDRVARDTRPAPASPRREAQRDEFGDHPTATPAGNDMATRETASPGKPSAAPEPDREDARWLRALTYAVLALAGFVAAGMLVLMRITAHLAAIANRR